MSEAWPFTLDAPAPRRQRVQRSPCDNCGKRRVLDTVTEYSYASDGRITGSMDQDLCRQCRGIA